MNGSKLLPDTAGEYELVSCVKSNGTESSCIVYDRICRRKAFLKTGRSLLIENEARILSSFAGKGIPQIYGCFEQDGASCLIRQYIDGRSLREYIESEAALSLSEIIDTGISVCETVSRLHNAEPPVIHRDIKADNIIISPDGEVYIIDFGISRIYDDSASRDTCVMGTLSSAPPEQFGYGQTDERSDVYSIGVMLKEAAEGYNKDNKKNIPSPLAAVIRKCTEFAPENRYRNAGEVKKALLKIKNGVYIKAVRYIDSAARMCRKVSSLFCNAEDNTQVPDLPDSAAYKFTDKAIEREVCRILGKEQGTITQNDLTRITEIKLIGNTHVDDWYDMLIHGNDIGINVRADIKEHGQVTVLDDLSDMLNLHMVILCNQNISDLSPLEGLSITKLALHGNNISDVSPLSSCPMLERLVLSSNPLSDLSPLSDHKKLFHINVGATNITDLNDIAKMPSVRELDIFDCHYLNDISPIEMKKMTFLYIRPADPEAVKIISRITTLIRLNIWSTESLGSPQTFSELKDLSYLLMDGCGLTSLDGIENFPKLKELQVRNNSINDFSLISGHKGITYLSLTHNPVKDWSFLSELEQLNTIFCDSVQAPDVFDVLGDRADDIEIIVQ